METNLKRLERLKTIRMPELTNQSADFQDCFEAGCKEFFLTIFEILIMARFGRAGRY